MMTEYVGYHVPVCVHLYRMPHYALQRIVQCTQLLPQQRVGRLRWVDARLVQNLRMSTSVRERQGMR